MPTITCPSGLKGSIRHLTIRDGRWLTDKKLQRQGKLIDRILSECWTSTDDRGIYKFNGSPNWSEVLIGDRDYALIAIRHESWGSYEFKITCESCGERFVWDLDLNEMLEQQGKPLPDASKAIFVDANLFTDEIELDETRTVKFKLAIGKDSARAFQDRQRTRKRRRSSEDEQVPNILVDAVMVRLVAVSGIDNGEHRKGLHDYIESLPMRALTKFIKTFDKRDCGVDTTVEYECSDCGVRGDVDLPFDQGFFFPKLRT